MLDRKKLFEQVAAHLERDILEGRLSQGEQLPTERQLQQRFGVGRPAIREALITLQRAGLIEIANGLRARVTVPTARNVFAGVGSAVRHMLSLPDGQLQLQGARMLFETGLAREAARAADEASLARLAAALAANESAIGDRGRFVETDVAFHFEIAACIGNPVFPALHTAMAGWLTDQRRITLELDRQEQTAFDAHVRIFGAIRARDPAAADAAMREHLAQLADAYAAMSGGAR